jgi:hypothetical protein
MDVDGVNDAMAAMDWWERLSEAERRGWVDQLGAGSTIRDAWLAFKAQAENG